MDAPTIDAYRDVTETVAGWPDAAHVAIEVLSEAGLILLAGMLALAGWRGRRKGARFVAVPLLGAIATLAAYLASQAVKAVVAQPRPCQALDAASTLVSCPPAGDWSLPSSHATIAAALAVAVVFALPRLGAVAIGLAVAVGLSRVAIGVHYPHDVADGLFLGAAVTALVVLALRTSASRLVDTATHWPWVGRVLAPSD